MKQHMSFSRISFMLAAGLLLAVGSWAPLVAAAVIVSDPGDRTLRGAAGMTGRDTNPAWSGSVGYKFTVGDKDVQVTHLGIYDGPGTYNSETNTQVKPADGVVGDGLGQPAAVSIYREGDATAVATGVVPAGNEGTGMDEDFTFRYVELEAPVKLDAGATYFIMAGYGGGEKGNVFHHHGGGTTAPSFDSAFTVDIKAGYFNAKGSHNKALSPAEGRQGTRAGSPYIGPNFQYTP